jgi:hypothetical protein
MGRFRDPVKKGSNGPKFPGIYLTWNAQSGTFRGTESTKNESRSVDVKNLNAIILEPSLYRVTGQTQDKRVKLWSNIAKSDTHDELEVMATTRGQNKVEHELVAKGIWKEVKETLLPQHMPKMRYTKCVAVAIMKADFSVYDREKGKAGKFKTRDFTDDYLIALLQLRGRSIIMSEGKEREAMPGVSWVGSLNSFFEQLKNTPGMPTREDDVDSCYIGCFDTFETKSTKGDIWLQPMFRFTHSSELPEDVLDKAYAKYKEVKAYLEAHWGHEDYFADDEADTPEDNDEGMSDGLEADNLGAKGKKAMF